MNNAKEKAIELVNKMYQAHSNSASDITKHFAIKCALIAIDEILNIDNIKPYILHKSIIEFYQEVKQEIEKI